MRCFAIRSISPLSKNSHLSAYLIVFLVRFPELLQYYQVLVVAFLSRLSSWYIGGWRCLEHEILNTALRCDEGVWYIV